MLPPALGHASVGPPGKARITMKKLKPLKPRPLTLTKETLSKLTDDQLKDVAGGNKSTRLSQCPTLCFT
jgi:hypothetical protein